MTADTAHITAQDGGTVTLSITVSNAGGSPAAGAKIRIKIAGGTAGSINDLGGGRYSATLNIPRLPPPRLPGHLPVLAVAEIDDETTAAGMVIPVYSNLAVRGKTAPGAKVYATAGNTPLGDPVIADESGEYKLTAPVPPGVTEVSIVPAGQPLKHAKSISIPDRREKQALVLGPKEVTAGTSSPQGVVTIFAVSETGVPDTAASLQLSCFPGSCSAPAHSGGGIYTAMFIPPEQLAFARISASAKYSGVTADDTFTAIPPAPASVKIASAKTSAAPGENVRLDISVETESGVAVDAAEVDIFADDIFRGKADREGPGRYSYPFIVPSNTLSKIISLRAEAVPAGGGARISSEPLSLEIVQAEIRLTVAATPGPMTSGEMGEVRVFAEDPSGAGVPDLYVMAMPSAGTAGAVSDLGDGDYSFTYTAPDEWPVDTVVITVSAPSAPGAPLTTLEIEKAGSGGDTTLVDSGTSDNSSSQDSGESTSTEDTTGQGGETPVVPIDLSLSVTPETAFPGDTVSLSATVSGDSGPMSGFVVTFQSDTGEVSSVFDSSNGSFSARLPVPESAGPGQVAVTASCECGGANLTADTDFTVIALPPDTIELAADRTQLYVGGGEEVSLDATVRNRLGGGVEGVTVNLRINDAGAPAYVSGATGPDGVAYFSFTPSDTEGTIEITASVRDYSSLSATAEIEKLRYDLSRIELTAITKTVDADGATILEIEVHAVNEAGADAGDERIELSVSGGGHLNADYVTTGDDGREYIQYTPDTACGTALLTAYSYRDTTVTSSFRITKIPAIAAVLSLVETPPVLSAGGDTWTLQVKVADAGGCTLENETVSFQVSSGGGSVTGSAATDADGIARAVYTSGAAEGTVTVTAIPQTAPTLALATDITVTEIASFEVTTSVSSVRAGQPFSVTTTAKNSTGETVRRYRPSGKTFSLSGPGAAPDSTSPAYPSSSAIASSFSNGIASFNITLYNAETTTLTFSDGTGSGTSGSITVSAAAADVISIQSGDDQSAVASLAVSDPLTVYVVDAYDNPAPGNSVTYTVTSGGGSIAGSPANTAANGTASSGAWTLGATPGANTVSASISSGSVSSVSFTATGITSSPSASITNQSGVAEIYVGQSLDFSGSASAAGTAASITSYSWDFDSDSIEDSSVVDPGAFTFNTQGIYSVSLTVTNSFGETSTALTTITVNPSPVPTAVITNESGVSTIYAGNSIDFSGTTSTPGTDASITSYSWDLDGDSVEDDNTSDPGAFTYNTVGSFLVSLAVINSFGNSDTATTSIKVNPAGSPIALITNQTGTQYICPGDPVDFSGTSSSTPPATSITSYAWDLDGDSATDDTTSDPAAMTYNSEGSFVVSLSVTNNLLSTDTATTTIFVADPGVLSITPTPTAIYANGADTSIVTSDTIIGCGGSPVADGTLFTVATTLGTVTNSDADAGTAGLQVASSGGTISFTVQAGTASGTANVVVESVDGTYSDFTSINMIGDDTTRPFVLSVSPAGNVSGDVSVITIVFSEDMNSGLLTNATKFKVQREKSGGGYETVSGSRSYDSGTFTATFTFNNAPYNIDDENIMVTLDRNTKDIAGNKLDGAYNSTDSDFVYHFGGAWTDCGTAPVVSSCTASPSPFSPDTSDSLPDTTDITISSTDDYYLKYWIVKILDGSNTVTSGAVRNAGCCETECAEAGTTCDTCCASNSCCTSFTGTYTWNGRNAAGELVENGTYTCEVTAYDIGYCSNDTPCSSSAEVTNPIDFGGYGP